MHIKRKGVKIMQEFLDNLWATLAELGTSFGLKLLGALLILIIGLKLSKWAVKIWTKSKGYQKIDTTVGRFLANALKAVLYTIVIMSAVITIGVPAASLITILGSAGVAVGLALQGSLSNLAGSIMIMIFRPFKIGDFIEGNGVSGIVEDITMFYTIIKTGDNKVITVPNGALSNGNITNYSKMDLRRVDFTLSAAYGTDVNKVKTLLMKLAVENELVLKDPAPFVALKEHGASSIDFVLRVWVNSADYWTVNFGMLETIYNEFNANGIEIPFPQMNVHVKQ